MYNSGFLLLVHAFPYFTKWKRWMKNVGKSCSLQREISIAFFRTHVSSTRFAFFLFFFFYFFFLLFFVHCLSPSSPMSRTTFCITPARTNDPYNRSPPQCARGLHIKESYLLMRSNYHVHNGWRQDTIVKSVGDVEGKRGWSSVGSRLFQRDMGVP